MDARIDGYAVPRCAFSIYAYPDPGDPAVEAPESAARSIEAAVRSVIFEVTPTQQWLEDQLRKANLMACEQDKVGFS